MFRTSLPFRSADSCDELCLVLASGTHRPRHRLKLRIRQGIHKGDALRCRTCIEAHDAVELHGGMDALLIEVRQRFDCSDEISRTRKRIDDQFKQFSRNGLIRLGGYIPALALMRFCGISVFTSMLWLLTMIHLRRSHLLRRP